MYEPADAKCARIDGFNGLDKGVGAGTWWVANGDQRRSPEKEAVMELIGMPDAPCVRCMAQHSTKCGTGSIVKTSKCYIFNSHLRLFHGRYSPISYKFSHPSNAYRPPAVEYLGTPPSCVGRQ
jgi:hypothetical protein